MEEVFQYWDLICNASWKFSGWIPPEILPMKGGFHEQLFGSVCIRFYEKKWCSMFHSYMFQNVSFNSMESWMSVPRKLLKLHQKAGSKLPPCDAMGLETEHVTWVAVGLASDADACNAMAGVTWRKKWWLVKTMLTGEACWKILNQVEFAKYILDDFPSSSLEKEIDLPMFILWTFATSLCNINRPRHVPAKFTTSNLKIPQRDAWPTYWNYTLLGRY